jgi:hypothetical protein
MPKRNEKPVCSTCESDKVLVDAYVEWNVEHQTWSVQNTFDKGSHCNTCGGECRIAWVEVA